MPEATPCSRCGTLDWHNEAAPRWVLGWVPGLEVARCACGEWQHEFKVTADGIVPDDRKRPTTMQLLKRRRERVESPWDRGDGKPPPPGAFDYRG